ncbi:hypothetical protein [Escherichia coli]|uniref:hypothetical protein n=1 Tax=Escherichia TaxID=561 RepID=UPI0013B43E75|nr:hypothetical protein [Escherichia coli]ELO4314998.1 hypothetical protein [Escherichia coli]ELO4941569.1 hypothetical protein [Escherichia coli]MDD8295102.1 hypothetical protein [Escherichia coli]MDE8009147.1 hypothetical protein [Escherichia coli]MDS1765150.1 hypothetical protein [Escherichia coli]
MYRDYNRLEERYNKVVKDYNFNHLEFKEWLSDNDTPLRGLRDIDINKLKEAHRVLTQDCVGKGINVPYSVEATLKDAISIIEKSSLHFEQLKELSVYKSRNH